MRSILFRAISAGVLAISIASGTLTMPAPGDACCSLRPAKFSKTKGWVGEAIKDGRPIHILAYGNSVKNLAGGDTHGNAMFLPIPAMPGTMDEKNLLDMSKGQHVLEDMQTSLIERLKSASVVTRGALQASAPRVQVFEHGVYTIVLAQHASDIPAALARVPENKRPGLNEKIFAAYEKWYPGWTFALCCFNNEDEQKAEPMLWWYQPKYSNALFFPALDCHTGGVPSLTAKVDVDHFLAASSPGLDKMRAKFPVDQGAVYYQDSDLPTSVKSLLPKYVVGTTLHGEHANGDFMVKLDDVRAGKFTFRRTLPPGAQVAGRVNNFKDLSSGTGF